jgi:hypothetical protein
MRRGLGDDIAIVTKFTGIDYVIKFIATFFDIDCGCEQRREWLNKKFPYKNNY